MERLEKDGKDIDVRYVTECVTQDKNLVRLVSSSSRTSNGDFEESDRFFTERLYLKNKDTLVPLLPETEIDENSFYRQITRLSGVKKVGVKIRISFRVRKGLVVIERPEEEDNDICYVETDGESTARRFIVLLGSRVRTEIVDSRENIILTEI